MGIWLDAEECFFLLDVFVANSYAARAKRERVRLANASFVSSRRQYQPQEQEKEPVATKTAAA
jgi:hypothetical protein